ncbi:MAG TPA: acyl-CoA dehydrogenase family protein, partial [Longimicrobiaceae bacterium]
MSFTQTPPTLGNQYDEDRALRSLLARLLPDEVLAGVEPSLREMGRLSAELYPEQLADLPNEPRLVQWDAWGNRVDRIELTPLWQRAERIAAEHGVVAAAYDGAHGRFARVHQFALAYLFTPSTDIYSCPLAMTDGAARALIAAGNDELVRRAVPHLTSRDPATFWTSGQWMTETPGGSDVGNTETVARRGDDGRWRLHGRKWFTSAATSQMALTLARPEGNPPGGRGLALFYLETRGADGRLNGIRIDRLKDKLGTRKLPTAELSLDGAVAIPVRGVDGGVRNIAPMLNVTRTWNAVSAAALMRRGVALTRAYAPLRRAFGAPLSDLPLHADTLAGAQAEFEGALHLTFRVVELLGRAESGELDDAGRALLRILTPIAKLATARQSVAVASEMVESFGGAGYVEDTGLP